MSGPQSAGSTVATPHSELLWTYHFTVFSQESSLNVVNTIRDDVWWKLNVSDHEGHKQALGGLITVLPEDSGGETTARGPAS